MPREVLRYSLSPYADLVCPAECVEICGIADDAIEVAAQLERAASIEVPAGVGLEQATAVSISPGVRDRDKPPKVELTCEGMRRRFHLFGKRVCREVADYGSYTGDGGEIVHELPD
jgi:hypothetical protein